ncbi:MAG: transcriptional repressor [Desulfobacterales bacterium]|nr:transcriptional repressor [Desulfobacterales bacterium]
MKSEIQVFREFIRKKGLRNTPEREAIIEEIFATHDHFDVDELYLRLKNKKKKISKPSIYRVIPYLLESGLIQEAYFEEGHLHYEHIYGHGHHCHLRCVKCGKTIEFQEKSLRRLEKKLAEKYDFVVKDHKFEVLGYCPKCKGLI